MLATLGGAPFDSDEWVFEIKWDGYRAIADLREGLQFYSRNGLSYIGRYKEIEKGLAQQPHRVVLDGEVVAYDPDGQPDFQKLQHYAENLDAPLVYHVFDLLHLNGHSTESLTLLERKELLKKALAETGSVQFCDHVENSGTGFFNAALEANLEGIMAKKKSSTYHEGTRTPEWLKIKNHLTDEAVIAGFTEPCGSRKYFGSLILGKYVDGEFRYAGHVGTGFSEKRLKEIHALLKPLITKEIPFDQKPATNAPPTWVKPEVVCTVKYSEVTADGLFRLPVFIALREDKEPEEVVAGDETLATDDLENVKFTNTDKLYWKKEKITKGALIDYYLSVSDYILPHLKDRAQSLHRFPNGIDGDSFYHKNAGEDAPSWVETIHIFSESNNREVEYIVCNDKDTLGYLVNLGCIELNPWSNRVNRPGKPDYLVIDLDPSEKNSFKQVVEAARVTKEVLDACGVTGYCKTSGSTGIHIFVPTGGEYTYDQVRDFAQVLMHFVQQRLPDTTTLERSLRKRGPKIYLDYMQNGEGQTVASTYSVRPKRQAPVSMPIEWNELTKDLSTRDFTIHNALDRLSKKGDIFLPVLKEKTRIEKAIEQLQSMD
jgi:bifunctional non-homologous end joining protein LigD